MSSPNFFRALPDGRLDSRHPLVVLTGRRPWRRSSKCRHLTLVARRARLAPSQPRTCRVGAQGNSALVWATVEGRTCRLG